MAVGELIIGDKTFKTGLNLKNWHDTGWDALSEDCIPTQTESAAALAGKCVMSAPGKYVPYGLPKGMPKYTQRYSTRPVLRGLKASSGGKFCRYEDIKPVIKQFVIHHDGCASADMCFNVVQNERGLSVHFLLDNDGTIYQTCDLGIMAYHACDWNLHSIGIELCNRGDAKAEPHYYDDPRHGPKRDKVPIKINNSPMLGYGYTKPQMDSLQGLARELRKVLPNLPMEYPQSSPGQQSWDTFKDATVQRDRYAGYVGHYHITAQKWDPGPFDFKAFCSGLRGALCFPVFPKGEPPIPKKGESVQEIPEIPKEHTELESETGDLYKLNEQTADGGFFPVGPWGEQRLWHGGVHLALKEGSPVFAPFAGRLVAARMGNNSGIGSFNFVLLRHDMTLAQQKLQFFSLYMHLTDETSANPKVPWTTSDAWKAAAKGDVVLLDEPIEAGVQIGRVGTVGPDPVHKAQVHVEFFSVSQLFSGDDKWTLVDGSAGGRFCDAPEITKAIDQNHDGILQRDEMKAFYDSGAQEELRHYVTLHVSEWTPDPDWLASLSAATDFRKVKKGDLEQMVMEQITPGLWWTERVAKHCQLPAEGVVYHYHPVFFTAYVNDQLLQAELEARRTTKVLTEADTKDIPKGVTDDLGDKDGTTMRSTDDGLDSACNDKLTLQEMEKGFDAVGCDK
ncbi:MAG TPA: N-acetylmuramoyl-L-alanine amidase [Kofleriaceae bacterium]|jgi:hypothetical protein